MRKKLLDQSCVGKFEQAIKYELYHAQLYRHLASQMQGVGYFGAQKKFLSEIPEENGHAQNHIDFLNDMGITVGMPKTDAISNKVTTLKNALTEAMEAEYDLLEYYKELAKTEGMEYPEILQHLLPYVEIQRKTVGEYGDLLARVELAKDDACALLIIDKELGK